MEDNLTTETIESDVNVNDENVEETQEVTDDLWNQTDINDTSLFDETPTSPVANEVQTEEEVQQEASDAFMSSSPVLKFKGKDIPIDNPEELINLAQKGFKLETEMSNIKPQKKILQTVSDVPVEILQAVADLHAGKQEAFEYLREKYNVESPSASDDFFNSGTEDKPTSYTPEVKIESEIETFWNDYSASNVESAGKVSEIYAGLEPSFQAEVYTDKLFPSFVQSVATGEFDSVYPLAIKEKSLNPAVSWIQAYSAAAQKVSDSTKTRNEPPQSATPPAPSREQGDRNISDKEAAARVWEDDDYYKQIDNQIFQI